MRNISFTPHIVRARKSTELGCLTCSLRWWNMECTQNLVREFSKAATYKIRQWENIKLDQGIRL
jgi:hypothetical protein